MKQMKIKIVILLIANGISNIVLAQSKFAKKGYGVFAEKKWDKFNDYLEKETAKDSNSVGALFLRTLKFDNDGPNPNAKLHFQYGFEFFNKLEKLDVKEQSEYCEELGYCVSNKTSFNNDNLKKYCNWTIQRSDTLEVNYFLSNFPTDININNIKQFQYIYFFKLLNTDFNKEHLRKYLSRFPQSPFYSKVFSQYDSLQFHFLKQQNSIQLMENYLSEFPIGIYRDSAQSIIERIAWTEICNSNSINDFIMYQNKFSSSIFSNLAKEKEISLTWLDVKYSSSIIKVIEFREKYKKSVFDNEAEILEGELFFEKVKTLKSIAKIRQFRESYKNSKQLDEAYLLEQEWVFGEIKNSKNTKLYEKYILDYPNSAFNKCVDSLINSSLSNIKVSAALRKVNAKAKWDFFNDFSDLKYLILDSLNKICNNGFCVSFLLTDDFLIVSYRVDDALGNGTQIIDLKSNEDLLNNIKNNVYVDEYDKIKNILLVSSDGHDQNGHYWQSGTFNLETKILKLGPKE
jgi:hypothetical protein